ncbi:MAG: SprT-like domain-containing protein [Gemmatimonas sp.]
MIVKVMARAVVPEQSKVAEARSYTQLGFDFDAPGDVARMVVDPPAARAPFDAPYVAPAPSVLPSVAPAFKPARVAPLPLPPPPPSRTSVDPGTWSDAISDALFAEEVPRPVVEAAPSANLPKSRGRTAMRARTAVMFSRLQQLGLRGIDSLVLMRTRTVMVSLIGQTLRVHEGYADAPEPVLRAIVTFATARHRATRMAARDAILAHDVERAPAARRAEPARPWDVALIASLMQAHREYNATKFGGALSEIPIRLSGRMATRLGHYDPGSKLTPPEIVMSRKHVVRHGWKEAMHTLVHEMVHQWQHENGQPIDHLAGFRKKCREVGITPAARRHVTPLAPRRRTGAA